MRERFGKELPEGVNIGESWELADLPEDKSEVVNGPHAGRKINEIIAEDPAAITGQDDYYPPFPLLIKLLDAQDYLSVQVHPDAEACRRMGKGDLKTECWYIISAEHEACIYKGFKPGVTPEQFAEAVKAGTAAELLEKVLVSEGECHFLPAGTPHAIGPGLLIAEIQTPSDTTYRVFDWNRIDKKTGRGRQLHIEEALESLNYDATLDKLPVSNIGRLVDCEFFKIDKGHQAPGCETLFEPNTMRVVSVITGSGAVVSEQADDVPFAAGDTILIPAAFEGVMTFADESHYLVTTL